MILAIIQARMSSTRLPGKVLMPIMGKPMLLRQVERVKQSVLINKIVVATSTEESDNPIEKLCQKNGIDCFRGSLNDVLDRFYKAATYYNADIVVRFTGDCPLVCIEDVDKAIGVMVDCPHFVYFGNTTMNNDWPDGLDVEVMTLGCLRSAWEQADDPKDREHVTSYIYKSGMFKCFGSKYCHKIPKVKLSVDTKDDFDRVSDIYKALYEKNSNFGMVDVMNFVKNMQETSS
jgi:spore coat polysaccharide biosynthesis protein SpsF